MIRRDFFGRVKRKTAVLLSAALIMGSFSGVNAFAAGEGSAGTDKDIVAYDPSDVNAPGFIRGRFYDEKVNGTEDALKAIGTVSDALGIEDVEKSLKLKYVHTLDFSSVDDGISKTTFYRFDQYYNGVKVFGSSLTLAVGEDGYVKAMSSYLPSLSELKNEYGDGSSISEYQGEGPGELVIYGLDGDPRYAYLVRKDGWQVFLDASTGEVINRIPLAHGVAARGEGANNYGVSVNFPVELIGDEEDGFYILYDKEDTGIKIFDAYLDGTREEGTDNRNVTRITYTDDRSEIWARPLPEKCNTIKDSNGMFDRWEVFSNDNTWDERSDAITAYGTLMAARKWWNSTMAFDGSIGGKKPKDVYAVLNYPETDVTEKDYAGDEILLEVFREGYRQPMHNAVFKNTFEDVLLVEIGSADNYCDADDILGHEFTHAMANEIADLVYHLESGAIDEAYADVMGELFSNTRLETIGEKLSLFEGKTPGYMRNLADPSVCDNPTRYSQCKFDEDDGDSGGVHTNSSIIEHAIYLLEQKIWKNDGKEDGSDPQYVKDISDSLARLVFNSIWYLPTNADFADCRMALTQAARDQGWSDTGIGFIEEALDEVEVKEPGTIALKFNEKDETVSENTVVTVSGVQIAGASYTLEYDSAKLIYTGKNLKKTLLSLLKVYDEKGQEVQVKSIAVKKLKDVNGGGTLTKIKLMGMKPQRLASPIPIKITPYAVKESDVQDTSRIDKKVRILNALGKKKTLKMTKGDYEYDADKKVIIFKGNYSGTVAIK